MTGPGQMLCGIDIGSDQVRAVVARVPEASAEPDGMTKLEVLAVGQAEHWNSVQYGEVVRPRGVTEAVRQAIEAAEEAAGTGVGSAFVAVGSRTRRSINSTGLTSVLEPRHRISESDVERAVKSAVPRDRSGSWLRRQFELLHALPQEFWVDDLDATEDPTGWTGEKIVSYVHLIRCPHETLERIEEAVGNAGIRIEKLVATPLAVGYGALHPDDWHDGVVVLDIGAMTTDIAVFRRGALWYSDLMPSGGRFYTKDVSLGFGTSAAHAERAKRRYGVALEESVPADEHFELPVSGGGHPKQYPRRLLAHILQHRAVSDLTKIRDQLLRVFQDQLPRNMVLTGGGANLDGLSEVARLVFGADTESRGPRDLAGLRDLAGHPQFACAVGLCRYGLAHRARASATAGAGAKLARIARAVADRIRRAVGGRR